MLKLKLSNLNIVCILFGLFAGFREGLDSLKYLEILSQDHGENKSEHSNERRSRQIATRLVQIFEAIVFSALKLETFQIHILDHKP